MEKLMLGLITFLIASSAHAHTYVKCGKTADSEKFEVTDYELELSSENDRYSGIVGKNWNLKLDSEDSEWLEVNKKITAKKTKKDGETIIDIRIITGRTPSGPVGTHYKLTGLYDEEPKLEKYNIGGFTGHVLVGTYQCLSAND